MKKVNLDGAWRQISGEFTATFDQALKNWNDDKKQHKAKQLNAWDHRYLIYGHAV